MWPSRGGGGGGALLDLYADLWEAAAVALALAQQRESGGRTGSQRIWNSMYPKNEGGGDRPQSQSDARRSRRPQWSPDVGNSVSSRRPPPPPLPPAPRSISSAKEEGAIIPIPIPAAALAMRWWCIPGVGERARGRVVEVADLRRSVVVVRGAGAHGGEGRVGVGGGRAVGRREEGDGPRGEEVLGGGVGGGAGAGG
ncbi:hypothetical protein ACJX0J_034392, partial [Zea mays]